MSSIAMANAVRALTQRVEKSEEATAALVKRVETLEELNRELTKAVQTLAESPDAEEEDGKGKRRSRG